MINQKIKLIAVDLDSTILYQGLPANDNDIKELKKLQDQGYIVTIVTGQSYPLAAQNAKLIGIDQYLNLMVCQNGAYISKVSEFAPISIEEFAVEDIKNLLHYFNEKKIIVYMLKYDEFDSIYFNNIESEISIKSTQKKKFIDLNKEKDFSKFTHIWTSVPTDGYENIFNDLKKQYQEKIIVVSSYVDDMSKLVYMFSKNNADKGHKLIELAAMNGIDKENILAFGDGGNDITMLKEVGCGVAMGNAQPYVKAAADYVTDDCKNSGVSNFCKKYFR